MITGRLRRESLCFLQGRSHSGGITKHVLCFAFQASYKTAAHMLPVKLVWLLFWAVTKEPGKIIMAPAGRDLQYLRLNG